MQKGSTHPAGRVSKLPIPPSVFALTDTGRSCFKVSEWKEQGNLKWTEGRKPLAFLGGAVRSRVRMGSEIKQIWPQNPCFVDGHPVQEAYCPNVAVSHIVKAEIVTSTL